MSNCYIAQQHQQIATLNTSKDKLNISMAKVLNKCNIKFCKIQLKDKR